jgi:Metallo-beta-lactamase superfamily
MIRIFHAIGQGAFYTEFFKDFIAVYDCGSDNNIDLIRSRINATFKQGTKIDAIFISHFHEDHVNGLEYLLNYCKVHRLFLPLLTEDKKIQLLIHNSLYGEDDKFVKKLILNPLETVSQDTQLFFIPNVDETEEVAKLETMSFINLPKSGSTLPKNIKFISGNIKNWVFIPFNFQDSKRSILLKSELSKKGINISNVRKFSELWSYPNNRILIKDVYNSIPGNFNTNSLTLYSGPEKGNRYPIELRYGADEAGCLYFGDYEANGSKKWKEFYNKYESYWRLIGTVQIPHHGSRYNYNRKINQIKPMISVISAEYSNRHRHPHSSTIKNIIVDGGWPLIVNEKNYSRVKFEIVGI